MKITHRAYFLLFATSFVFFGCASKSSNLKDEKSVILTQEQIITTTNTNQYEETIDNGTWKASEIIIGVYFSYTLSTKPDGTFLLTGTVGSAPVNDQGRYKKVDQFKIETLDGELSGYTFELRDNSVDMYTDEGDYIMTLY